MLDTEEYFEEGKALLDTIDKTYHKYVVRVGNLSMISYKLSDNCFEVLAAWYIEKLTDKEQEIYDRIGCPPTKIRLFPETYTLERIH